MVTRGGVWGRYPGGKISKSKSSALAMTLFKRVLLLIEGVSEGILGLRLAVLDCLLRFSSLRDLRGGS